MRGKLIVFEGIDGVGKSTLAKETAHALLKSSNKAILWEDIEEKQVGFNLIKKYIKSDVSFDSSFLFYLSSSIHKSSQIEKLLAQGTSVICDRYIYSTLAYHRAHGVNVNQLVTFETLPILKPDFYFLLKTDESVRIQRVTKRAHNNPDDFQPKTKGSFFEQMENYLLEYNPIVIDNSSMDIKTTVSQVLSLIQNP